MTMPTPGRPRHRRAPRHRPRHRAKPGRARASTSRSPTSPSEARRGARRALRELRRRRARSSQSDLADRRRPRRHSSRAIARPRSAGIDCLVNNAGIGVAGARRPARPRAGELRPGAGRQPARHVFLTQAVARRMLAHPPARSRARSSPSPRSAPSWPRPSAPTTASPRPASPCGPRRSRCGSRRGHRASSRSAPASSAPT